MEPPIKCQKLMCFELLLEDFSQKDHAVSPISPFLAWKSIQRWPSFQSRGYRLLNVRLTHLRIPDFYESWINRYLDYDFFLHFRMTRKTSEKILNELGHLSKQDYIGGFSAVPLEKKLLLTLWYLAKGDTMISTGDRFNVVPSTVFTVNRDIIKGLKELAVKFIVWPTESECIKISQEFRDMGGYPSNVSILNILLYLISNDVLSCFKTSTC